MEKKKRKIKIYFFAKLATFLAKVGHTSYENINFHKCCILLPQKISFHRYSPIRRKLILSMSGEFDKYLNLPSKNIDTIEV